MQKKNNSLHQRVQTNTVRPESEPADASENPNELETHGAANDCGSQVEDGIPSAIALQSPGHRLHQAQPASGTLTRRATGPRTLGGKSKSKYNATKHGVFSKIVLMKGESEKKYTRLLRCLFDDFQPEGALEELLVQKLAMIVWRHSRLLRAEYAGISKECELAVEHSAVQAVDQMRDRETAGGLAINAPSSYSLRRALVLLKELRGLISERGLNINEDLRTLFKLYGFGPGDEIPDGLFTFYQWRSKMIELYSREGEKNPRWSPDLMKAELIGEIDEEVKRLEGLKNWVEELERRRLDWNVTSALLSSQGLLERIVRYEAHLSREFERTLSQLERLQRLRRGQPVAPQIQVSVSH